MAALGHFEPILKQLGNIFGAILGPHGNCATALKAAYAHFLHSRSYMSFMALLSGREYSLDEFVPIGNFSILQPDALSLLSPELTTPQVQEAILKEPSRAIRAIDDLKKGHSLEDYYLAHITTLKLHVEYKSFSKLGSKRVQNLCRII